uniref:NMDA receptor synaptonuclear signaling and neuronal migration factor n=1 Tax=Callorhinchus milii TaxID=7868 RepID=A0A4W3GV95_CALMI
MLFVRCTDLLHPVCLPLVLHSSPFLPEHLLAEAFLEPDDTSQLQSPVSQNKRRLSVTSHGKFERSFSDERSERSSEGQKPRVYTISGESQLLSESENEATGMGSERSGKSGHPLHSSGSSHSVNKHCKSWAGSRQSSKDCSSCRKAAVSSNHSFDLDHLQSREAARHRKKLERMYSVDKVSDDVPIRTWFPKENLFTFPSPTTTMQRREKSFSRSWSDPTPIKSDLLCGSRESQELQSSCSALDDDFDDLTWEAEKELESLSCDGEDFVSPKIMLISSKVPKAEYIPTIIRRDNPSIIPILYDHEHATFDDILEEIEKKLNAYRRGCKIWKMLFFCQGGPGHLYLLKNKVATFAKVGKEEDLILFWKRLSKLMSKINPEPNVIHIMGCYILGNPNGEKLFRSLKTLMAPHRISFESPLELSAQGKRMIETYFDFRLYRLWKTKQHSKLLGYDDVL